MKTKDMLISQTMTIRNAAKCRCFDSMIRIILLMLAMLASPAMAASPPPSFAVEDLVTNLDQPMSIRFFPDGRMLLAQKKGKLSICEVLGATRNVEEYGNLASAQHAFGINFSSERGLIDIAIDPDFPASPYIYVFYTPEAGASGRKVRVARFTHTENAGGTSSRLDMSSEVLLWRDTQGYDSCCHYGGGIDFGPEGRLWITTGDHFQGSYASSLTKAGGKVHRINKDGSIPSDNPYDDGAGPNVDSTFAYGLRNPFRARWDLEGNTFYFGEVGGNTQSTAWEDLHVIRYDEASGRFIDDDFGTGSDNGVFDGINFGWPTVEGRLPHNDWPAANIDDRGEPVFAYKHGGNTAAITGGVVYRGTQFPGQYDGAYFFADSTRDFIRYLEFNPDGSVDPNPANGSINQLNPDPDSYPFDLAPEGRVVAFEVGPDGGLYYVSFTDAGGAYGEPNPSVKGAVRRYVYDGGNLRPELNEFTVVPPTGGAPLSVTFTIEANDLNADPMTYTLNFGDGTTPATGSIFNNTPVQVGHSFASEGSYEAVVTVSDGGLSTSSTLTVQVGTPPTITSLTATNDDPVPPAGFFRFGDTYTFAATAVDSDNQPIPLANYTWSVSFVRPGNTHPAVGPVDGVSSLDFPIPSQGQGFSGPVYYKAFVTVADDDGLTTTSSIDIFPEKANIAFDTVPSGVVVQVDGNTSIATPFVLDTLINYTHTITVPETACVVGTEYLFTGWSNGPSSPQQNYVVPPTDTALTASYAPIGTCGPASDLVLDGLVLHLESDLNVGVDGSVVSTWLDQSGLGNDLEVNGAPQFVEGATPSGLPSIILDGVDDSFERINATDPLGGLPGGNASRSMFVVSKYSGVATAQCGIAYGNGASNEAFGIAVQPSTGNLVIQGWAGANDFVTNEDVYDDEWSVQNATVGGGKGRMFKDGDQVGEFTHNYDTQLDRIAIGEEIDELGFQGMDISAVLVYNRELDEEERNSVTAFLEKKYLTPNSPPVVSITDPGDGTAFLEGDPVQFEALSFDAQEGDLSSSIVWTSNIDGPLGSGETVTAASLSTGTHLITASVTDNSMPALTGSTSITISVGVSVPVRNGIVLHLEADSGVGIATGSDVATWDDLSVSGNDLSASGDPELIAGGTPTGLPAIRFDGTGDKLDRVDAIEPINDLPAGNSERTMVVVSKYPGGSTSFAGTSYGKRASNQAYGIVVNHPTGELLLQGYGTLNDSASATVAFGAGWMVQSAVLDGGVNTLFKDGVEIHDFTHNYNTQLDKLVIGEEIGGEGHVVMDVAAVLIYDRALSPAELAMVEEYLAEKYITGPVNELPVVSITSPNDGATLVTGQTLVLEGSAIDDEDGDISASIAWSSDQDGALGSGASISVSNLSLGTHVLTAEVTDANSGVGSDSVTVSVGAPTSILPVASGLVLHLESTEGVGAGGSTVNGWADLSGQGNNLGSAGDPQLLGTATPAGMPAISLDGAGDKLERLNSSNPLSGLPVGSSPRTLFVVADYPGGSSGYAGVSYGNNATGQAFGVVIKHPSGELVLQGYGATDIVTAEPGIGAGWMVQTATVGGGKGTLFKDGVQVAQATRNYNTVLNKLIIGEEIGGLGSVVIDVAAVIAYDRELSQQERESVEAYLTSKYLTGVGANTAPVVSITSPADASSYTVGQTIDFTATATDTEDGDLSASLEWTSDLDGSIGTGASISTDSLSTGTHTITATATDTGNVPGTDSITLVINPPSSILPVSGGVVLHLESTEGVTAPGGAISEWTDLSSKGNKVFAAGDPMLVGATTPTGLPALVLDGAGDKLVRLNSSDPLVDLPAGDDPRTMFVVADYTGLSSGFAGVSYGNNMADEAFGVVIKNPSGELVLQGYGASDLVSAEPGISAGWMVQTAMVGGGNGTLLKDGVQIAQAARSYDTVLNKLIIGEEIGGAGFVAIDVAAVIIYDRELTPSERASVEGYLTSKYLTGTPSNQAPVVEITSPADASNFTSGQAFGFTATAADAEDGDVAASITWTSDVDGTLGSGASISVGSLSIGNHTITATALDTENLPGTDSITVVIDPPPSTLPVSGGLVVHLESTDGVTAPGGTVSEWADLSGLGNKVFATGNPMFVGDSTPTGRPALALDGAGDKLERLHSTQPLNGLPTGDGGRTMFLVVDYPGGSSGFAGAAYGNASTAEAFGLGIKHPSGELVLQGYGATDITSSTQGIGTGWMVQSASVGSGQGTMFKDGVQVAQAARTYDTVLNKLVFGEEIGGMGSVVMDVAALIIYDRELTPGERASVDAYLRNKYIDDGNLNIAPVVNITSPAGGSAFANGTNVFFSGTADDAEDGDLSSAITWISSIDGVIGTGDSISSATLSTGIHVVTAEATDSESDVGTASVAITIEGPVDPNLVAKWHLDEADGNVAYDAVGTANGTVSAGPVWRPVGGKLNGALDFGGDAERVNVSSFDLTGTEMTIAAWVKPESFAGLASESRFVSKAIGTSEQDHYWMVGNYGDGSAARFRLKTSDGGTTTLISGSGELTLNEWNHLAVTYDGTNMRIHVNGAQVAITPKTGTISGAGALIGLGNQPTGSGDRGLDGLLDDVCIFSRALSAGEISTLANPTIPSNLPPVVVVTAPSEGAEIVSGTSASFTASAVDAADGDLSSSVSWSSNIDGSIGFGASVSTTGLSDGYHTIIASVTDSGGLTATSSISVVVGPVESFLSVTNGLVLCLESTAGVTAPGGSVASWSDLTSEGNDLYPGGDPSLIPVGTPSGLPAIELDGNDKLERMAASSPISGLPAGNADRTMFVVAEYPGASTAWAGASYGRGATNKAFGFLVTDPEGKIALQAWGTGNDLVTAETGKGVGWMIKSGQVSDGNGTIFKDGAQVGQYSHNFNTEIEKLVIGEEISGLGYVEMKVAAMLVYDRALSPTEMDSVNAYLEQKYLTVPVSPYPDGYETWLTSFGLTGEFDTNSDTGVLSNLHEFLLGYDPTDGEDDGNFKLTCSAGAESIILHYPELVATGSFHLHHSMSLDDIQDVSKRIHTITPAEIELMTPMERANTVYEVPTATELGFFMLVFDSEPEPEP